MRTFGFSVYLPCRTRLFCRECFSVLGGGDGRVGGVFWLIRAGVGHHLRSSSSSSRCCFWLCRASPAGPQRAGSPAPSGSRRGRRGCRSGRGKGHRPSTPHTRHTSRHSAAEAKINISCLTPQEDVCVRRICQSWETRQEAADT